MNNNPDVDIAIIGAGIAGAATARELARRGVASVAILEREFLAGSHATGRNAALVQQNVTDETGVILAREGTRFYASPPPDLVSPPAFRRTGSLLLTSGENGVEKMRRDTEVARGRGLHVEMLTAGELRDRVPMLNAGLYDAAAFCPDDGVVDIHGLMYSFLGEAEKRGVLRFHCRRVHGIRTEGGVVTGVETDRGFLRCRTAINAAGPWAARLGAEIGAPLPLHPTRRHLVITSPLENVDPDGPFVWDLDRPFYFRPESGGLLLCPCDEDDAEDLSERVEPRWVEATLEKAHRLLSGVGGLAYAWCGIRTMTPDDRFVIGFDDRVKGYFWVAGLGGHGITCAPAIGRIAADLILEGRTTGVDAALLAPGRFRVPGPRRD